MGRRSLVCFQEVRWRVIDPDTIRERHVSMTHEQFLLAVKEYGTLLHNSELRAILGAIKVQQQRRS